jgi:hypothetical protein
MYGGLEAAREVGEATSIIQVVAYVKTKTYERCTYTHIRICMRLSHCAYL